MSKKEVSKVIRNGKVAVLISPNFGAGWSTWNQDHQDILLFHPKLIKMVEEDRVKEIDEKWVEDNLGIAIDVSDNEKLEIEWVKEGSEFYIEEYDGAENLVFKEGLPTVTA